MIKNLLLTIKLIIVFLLSYAECSNAWGPLPNDPSKHTTHQDITSYAVEQSMLYVNDGAFLKQLGFSEGIYTPLKWNVSHDGQVYGNTTKRVIQWLSDVGAPLEDGNLRELNHFHNPLTNSGLWGVWLSTAYWAQDGNAQAHWTKPAANDQPMIWDFQDSNPFTDWSWQKTRERFYSGLTPTSDIDRQANFAKMFRGLGQQMHLLQDMSVPAHVRNNSHLRRRTIEGWAAEHIHSVLDLKSLAPDPVAPSVLLSQTINGLMPIARLFDTDIYQGAAPIATMDTSFGLAEWTNSNFFSEDTIFTTEFPYPKEEETTAQLVEVIAEDGQIDTRYYIYPANQNYTLAAYSYFANEMQYWKYTLDDNVYKDNAQLLLPRAIGYSAALLNYFFRGTMEVSLPDDGVYSVADPQSPNGFTKLRLKVKNTTANNEVMSNGTIQVVVHYRLAKEDPFQNHPVEIDQETSYTVSAPVSLPSLEVDNTQNILFDLSAHPIPFRATNVYAQVVFRGKLGNEEGAVAVGYKDLSEPTPVDIINTMDTACLNGTLYTAGSDTALQTTDAQNTRISTYEDLYKHGLQDVYIKFASPASPLASRTASSSNYHAAFSAIPSGRYGRVFILTEPHAIDSSISVDAVYIEEDTRDNWEEDEGSYMGIIHGLLHQTVRTPEGDQSYYPALTPLRGMMNYTGVNYTNGNHPDDIVCDDNLYPDPLGPVTVVIP